MHVNTHDESSEKERMIEHEATGLYDHRKPL